MNLDWKKLGVIAMFIGAILLFGFFIYFFFFRPLFVTPNLPAKTAPLINGQLPVTVNINGRLVTVNANGRLPSDLNANANAAVKPPAAQGETTKTTLFIDKPVLYTALTTDGGLIYYNPADGKFYYTSATGETRTLSSKVFFNVKNVAWSNDRASAVLEYPDGSNIIYNFQTNEQITLPQHWSDFDFSTNDQQLVFKSNALDIDNRYLAVSDNRGGQTRLIERLGDVGNQFTSNWSPNNQMIATFTEGKDANRSNVYFVGLNNENFKLMTVEGRDFRGQWAPDGNRIIYSVYDANNDYKPELWVADAKPDTIGNNRQKINLQTWADKCTFGSNSELYCAVPDNLPFGAGLEPNSANTAPDSIYQINLNTGAKKLVATLDNNHTIDQLFINQTDNTLLFKDKNFNLVYKINLP